MRYRLRTLLLLMALLPPLLWFAWTKYETWRAELAAREQRATLRLWLVDGAMLPPPALPPKLPSNSPRSK